MSQEDKGQYDPWKAFFTMSIKLAEVGQWRRASAQEAAAIWQSQEKDGVFDREPVHPGRLVSRDFNGRPGIEESYMRWRFELKKGELEEFLQGRMAVTEKLASYLSRVFNLPASFFLDLQAGYDRSRDGS